MLFFLSITSIVLYQKLSSESRRDEFNFDIIYTIFNFVKKLLFYIIVNLSFIYYILATILSYFL